MGRMQMKGKGKGISSSALPYRRKPSKWVTMTPSAVNELIVKLAKKGLSPSQIGVLLRDQHGIAQVKVLTGKKILRILKKNGCAPNIPEDLYNLIKKAVSIRKHLEKNRKDKDSKYRLILVEARIHRLTRYYRKHSKLPPNWRYDSATASTLPKGIKKKGGKVKKADKVKKNPLFEKRPRNFRIGGDIAHKRDLTRFVKWPHYIVLQRQKRILFSRLKVPPAINQFSKTLDKTQAAGLLKFLKKYTPESKVEKRARLVEEAKLKAEGQTKDKKKPVVLKFGLNHVTTLIEEKKAKLVVIAHDVDPIELVLWLPQLCRKQEVPFCFVKSKERLGKLVHQKTASCVALTEVRKEDQADFDNYCKNFKAAYNENSKVRKEWGGGHIGIKSQHQRELKALALEKEALKKVGK